MPHVRAVSKRPCACSLDFALRLWAESRMRDGRTTTASAGDTRSLGVWTLAWPTIVSNLLYSAAGFLDIKIVGALGPSAVAALTTGLRIFFAMQAVLMAVTAGTTALVARAWGAGDRDEAAEVTRLSLWLCLALTLVVTVPVVIWAEQFAGIFRLDPDTVAKAA